MVGTNTVKGKEYYDLNLSNLPVYLVKAMQEQQQMIEQQNKKIEALENEIERLTSKSPEKGLNTK